MERRSAPDELRFSDDDLLSFGSSVRPDSPYKLLAVDLDGTVLSRDGVPHAIDRAAIARLRDHGVPTTIVTGRLYSGSREIARTLGIEGPIACVDGSQIVDTRSDEEVFVRARPQAVSFETEVLQTVAGNALVRHHLRRPRLEVLNAQFGNNGTHMNGG